MAISSTEKRMVQLYDRETVRVYERRFSAFIFSWWETVHTDKIGRELLLQIDSPSMPDLVIYNGKRMRLVSAEPEHLTETLDAILKKDV